MNILNKKKEQAASEERKKLELVRNALAEKIIAPKNYQDAKNISVDLYRWRCMPIEWLFPKAEPLRMCDLTTMPTYKEPKRPKEWDDLRRYDDWAHNETCAIETATFHMMNKMVGE